MRRCVYHARGAHAIPPTTTPGAGGSGNGGDGAALSLAERWWRRAGIDAPLSYAAVIAINTALSTLAITMLLSSVDRYSGMMPVSMNLLLLIAAAKMALFTGTAVGVRAARSWWRRRRGSAGESTAPLGATATATTEQRLQQLADARMGRVRRAVVRARRWLVSPEVCATRARFGKIVLVAALFSLAVALLRFFALLLLAGHFAAGDMSAVTLAVPCTMLASVALRALLLDRVRRRMAAREIGADARIDDYRRQQELMRERLAASCDALRYVAMLIAALGTIAAYYPATLEVPAFESDAVRTFAAGLPALAAAAVALAAADILLELYARGNVRAKAGGRRRDRTFAFKFALALLLCQAASYVALDIIGGDGGGANAIQVWLEELAALDRVHTLPTRVLAFLAPNAQAHLWYFILTFALSSAALMHCVTVVVTRSAVPALFAACASMTLAFGAMMIRRQPALPSFAAFFNYVSGVTLVACAVYVYRWRVSAKWVRSAEDVERDRGAPRVWAAPATMAPPPPPLSLPPPPTPSALPREAAVADAPAARAAPGILAMLDAAHAAEAKALGDTPERAAAAAAERAAAERLREGLSPSIVLAARKALSGVAAAVREGVDGAVVGVTQWAMRDEGAVAAAAARSDEWATQSDDEESLNDELHPSNVDPGDVFAIALAIRRRRARQQRRQHSHV